MFLALDQGVFMIKQNKMASILLPVALIASVFSFSNSLCINIADRYLQYREEETNKKLKGLFPEERKAFARFLKDKRDDLISMNPRDRDFVFDSYCIRENSELQNRSTCKCEKNRREGFMQKWESTTQLKNRMHKVLDPRWYNKVSKEILYFVRCKKYYEKMRLQQIDQLRFSIEDGPELSEEDKEIFKTCHPKLAD